MGKHVVNCKAPVLRKLINSEKELTINLFPNNVREGSRSWEAINILLINTITDFNFTKLVCKGNSVCLLPVISHRKEL